MDGKWSGSNEQLYESFQRHNLTIDAFLGARLQRIKHVRELMASGDLDASLRWQNSAIAAVGA